MCPTSWMCAASARCCKPWALRRRSIPRLTALKFSPVRPPTWPTARPMRWSRTNALRSCCSARCSDAASAMSRAGRRAATRSAPARLKSTPKAFRSSARRCTSQRAAGSSSTLRSRCAARRSSSTFPACWAPKICCWRRCGRRGRRRSSTRRASRRSSAWRRCCAKWARASRAQARTRSPSRALISCAVWSTT